MLSWPAQWNGRVQQDSERLNTRFCNQQDIDLNQKRGIEATQTGYVTETRTLYKLLRFWLVHVERYSSCSHPRQASLLSSLAE